MSADFPQIYPPDNIEDYSTMWMIDVTDKIVLDIGADRGSTASHFLRYGAAKIICIDGSEEMYTQLLENISLLQYRVEAVYLVITDSEAMAQALSYPAEIVKMDIEGAEEHLLGVSPEMIRSHEAYMIEFHYNVDVEQIKNYLASCGFMSQEIMRTLGWDITYFWRLT